jgi:Arc/MetJ-type ribon-helix-helix transcriptional regulator
MATMKISLTDADHLRDFVEKRVAEGAYRSVGE